MALNLVFGELFDQNAQQHESLIGAYIIIIIQVEQELIENHHIIEKKIHKDPESDHQSYPGGNEEFVDGRPVLMSLPKPRPDDDSAFARWLVSQSSWGILRNENTISSEWGGAPFGNVVSFSDGLPDKGKGIPYFYLTTLDPTARDALKDHRSSLALSEYSLGTCGNTNPQFPTCAKITLVGKLKLIEVTKEAESAWYVLSAKHPEMKSWPKSHSFQVYKLDIENIFMINGYDGPKLITVEQYLKTKMNKLALNVALTTNAPAE
ncbi:hypothetical protein CASFOL_026483 [Castilleja foliolosa]|uniref:CREG-like beta-barrel domain-containing protein n=1 Tax=Castilleja foliolosa TaxID=1961234 RepID=A0ABD3CJX7_9LAMI